MRFLLLPALALALLLAAACTEEDPETQAIVDTIPWEDGERAEYLLFEDVEAEQELGEGVLTVTAEDGTWRLEASFEGQGDTDESVIVVDEETLRPLTVRREVHTSDRDLVIEGEYDDAAEEIRVVVIRDGDERTLPRRLDVEHYYDNESSIFVWRTIPLQEDFEAHYYTVLASDGGTRQLVTLEVQERETIEVPAGTFETWRVRMSTEGVTQTIWIADTPERQLVQYNTTRNLFQLASYEP